MSSDPIAYYKHYKTNPICKICIISGHTVRSCKSKTATAPSEDDFLFNELIIP